MPLTEARNSKGYYCFEKTKKRMNRMKRSDYIWAYAMILPTMLGTLIFNIWPLFQSFYLSLTKWEGFGQYSFSGLDNYKRLFQDAELLSALKNTAIFTRANCSSWEYHCRFWLQSLLNQKIRGVTVYRTLYFLPVVTMPAAVAIVWKWLYNADFGLINYVLGLVGIGGPNWLTDPNIALYSFVYVAVWGAIGYNMVIILSGLQGISQSYYEAAEIDGASSFVMFFKITLHY